MVEPTTEPNVAGPPSNVNVEVDQIATVIGDHWPISTGCSCNWTFPSGGGGRLRRLHNEHVAEKIIEVLHGEVGVPPLPSDGLSKFSPTPPGACEPGEPVRDATYLFSGEPCCSSCRRLIEVAHGTWVHAPIR